MRPMALSGLIVAAILAVGASLPVEGSERKTIAPSAKSRPSMDMHAWHELVIMGDMPAARHSAAPSRRKAGRRSRSGELASSRGA